LTLAGPMFAIRSSLHLRLTLVLLGLFVLLALAAVLIARPVALAYQQEVAQRINRDVAMYIANDHATIDPAAPDRRRVDELFKRVMIVNPTVEVYLLDAAGRVTAYAEEGDPVRVAAVDLAPLRAFIGGSQALPIMALNPRTGASTVFSAAPIGDPAAPRGYVYAVLGGMAVDAAMTASGGRGRMTIVLAAFIACLAFLLVTGLLLFRALTGRLQRLTDRVEAFRAGGFAGGPPPADARDRGGEDEIARLREAFDAMAVRIAAQVRELESIDRVRREAVLNASHDLRTPLAALQGYLQTLQLKSESLTPEQRMHYVDVAQRHATRLRGLVEQMFELAKLDAPETAPRIEIFSLPELVGDIAQKYQLHASRQRLKLTASIDPAVPPLAADIGMVERLVENLVDNALKFTPAGGSIALEVGFDPSRPQRDTIELAVTDTGRGLAADELPRIFDRFYRVDRADAPAGSGLGLAIVKRIAELHGADVAVASDPGAGSRFSVRFATTRT